VMRASRQLKTTLAGDRITISKDVKKVFKIIEDDRYRRMGRIVSQMKEQKIKLTELKFLRSGKDMVWM
jgi:hypothetical protein